MLMLQEHQWILTNTTALLAQLHKNVIKEMLHSDCSTSVDTVLIEFFMIILIILENVLIMKNRNRRAIEIM